MKLIGFKRTEVPVKSRTVGIGIRLNTDKGCFSFNDATAKNLGLEKSTHVMLYQDSERSMDWYLEVGNTDGFKVNYTESRKYTFYNKFLSGKIAQSCGLTSKSIWIPIATKSTTHEGLTLYALITKGVNHGS